MMADGLVSPRTEGSPQGGPLSPLLSNILLDELDKELEKRGHMFCRYADDCNVYVRSRQAGERVLASLIRFLEKRLKLKVNAAKSAVDRPWNRKFLGYSMTYHQKPRLKEAPVSVKRLRAKLREVFRHGRGRNLLKVITELTPILRGWVNYFRLAEVKGVFEDLDAWIRRKFRCIFWRQWKRPWARARNMMKRGLSEERAWKSATNGRGPWWSAGASHMNQACPKSFFDGLGLMSLLDQLHVSSMPHEPPGTEPYAGWWGRSPGVTPPPTRLARCRLQTNFVDGVRIQSAFPGDNVPVLRKRLPPSDRLPIL